MFWEKIEGRQEGRQTSAVVVYGKGKESKVFSSI